MRGRTDPAWKRYYYDEVDRAHILYREMRISGRELRRKIEAARKMAYQMQEAR